MIGPRVPDNMQKEYCVRNFEINSIFGHSMNCDSADYILNASNPKRLLEEDSIRQARPGLIINANNNSFFIDKVFLAFLDIMMNIQKQHLLTTKIELMKSLKL